MSSKTHGKFILPEEQQIKNILLSGVIPGIKKNFKKSFCVTFSSKFHILVKNNITTVRNVYSIVCLYLFKSFFCISINLRFLFFHIFY